MLKAHKGITQQRKEFLQDALVDNEYVRMEVIAFGFEARSIERELRELLECPDDRFEHDILRIDGGKPKAGLAFELT